MPEVPCKTDEITSIPVTLDLEPARRGSRPQLGQFDAHVGHHTLLDEGRLDDQMSAAPVRADSTATSAASVALTFTLRKDSRFTGLRTVYMARTKTAFFRAAALMQSKEGSTR